MNKGSTPLHYAVLEGNFEIVKLLIDHGAQVDAKDNENKTPFDLSSKEIDLAEQLGKEEAIIRVVYDRVRKRKYHFEIPAFLQIERGKSRAENSNSKSNENKNVFVFIFIFI